MSPAGTLLFVLHIGSKSPLLETGSGRERQDEPLEQDTTVGFGTYRSQAATQAEGTEDTTGFPNKLRVVKRNVLALHQFGQYTAQTEVNGGWDKYSLGFTEGALWPSNSKAALDKIKNSPGKQKEVFRGQLSTCCSVT